MTVRDGVQLDLPREILPLDLRGDQEFLTLTLNPNIAALTGCIGFSIRLRYSGPKFEFFLFGLGLGHIMVYNTIVHIVTQKLERENLWREIQLDPVRDPILSDGLANSLISIT